MTGFARLRKPLLIVHIVATVSLIGTALVLAALGIAGLRGAEPFTIYPAAYLIETQVVAPIVVIALVTGLLLALSTEHGLTGRGWVMIKLVTTSIFAVIVFLVLIPRLSASADAAIGTPQSFDTSERLPLAIAPTVATVILVLNVVLAIYKPDLRFVGKRSKETRSEPLRR